MVTISKIRLRNFKRFRDCTIVPDEHMNILVGDNESGKSSILEAIDMVINCSRRRLEEIGLDRLLNNKAVEDFLKGERKFDLLPQLRVELFLSGKLGYALNGRNNLEGSDSDGIRLICEPNIEYSAEITEALKKYNDYFPYEYYKMRFTTFSDEEYSFRRRIMRSVLIDGGNLDNAYVTDNFVNRMYEHYMGSDAGIRVGHNSEYRRMRDGFSKNGLKEFNEHVSAEERYKFGLKGGSAMNIEGDLMIYEDGIGIDRKGTGRQVFIKTDFALSKAGECVDVILMEEPENHLSPVNLRKLVQTVSEQSDGQMFITTHSSYISTRLDLNKLQILDRDKDKSTIRLCDLKEDTAKYFMKTPPAGIIEFALSHKTILVEGPSEYMLMERFYHSVMNNTPEDDGVSVIDIRGLSFKRYLEIAKLLRNKVAVVTDNDGDYQGNIKARYSDYDNISNIKVFSEEDDESRTFEVVLYKCNKPLCDSLFNDNACERMLKNKTECAYQLLSQDEQINVPYYIQRAIEWIKE